MQGRGTVFVLDGDVDVQKQLLRIAQLGGIEFEAFTTAAEFLGRGVHELALPSCLVLELNLPESSGIDLQETLNRQKCAIPLIFLTSATDIPTVVRAIQGGAFDYIQKPAQDETLRALISEALVWSECRNMEQSKKDAVRDRIRQLSRQERAVFELLTNGKSNKEIAGQLSIGVPTVTRHRSKVFRKLGVRNVVQLLGVAQSSM